MFKDLIEKNRWYVLIGAILIQLALGSLYSWGTLTVFVSPYLNEAPAVTVFVFGLAIIAFAITMTQAGILAKKFGPQKTVLIGGVVIAVGVFASAGMTNLAGLMITYGLLFGLGIGIAYVVPIAVANKWFPDKKGLITGLAVTGFGAGSFIFNYLIRFFAPLGIPVMFILLGIFYTIFLIGGALFMYDPDEGYKPDGWEPTLVAKDSLVSTKQWERIEMVKTNQFWFLWGSYFLSAMCGLMLIGTYGSFATSDSSYLIDSADLVVLTGSIGALFNGAGRIVWGKLADQINFRKSMVIIMSIQAVILFIYFSTSASVAMYFLLTGLIMFCFGGNLSLFPTATSDMYGTENLGNNYGVLFSAYGVAGFIGAVAVNQIVLLFGGYLTLYIFLGILSAGAAVLAFLVRPFESGLVEEKSEAKEPSAE
ncbi:MAG: MFS transporter [Promethearchaeota archaeon]|nr:MAG: MFS transporter [Candidatus Lokiarchaeota archaeon]